MTALFTPIEVNGRTYPRRCWTGGDLPPVNFRDPDYLALRRFFFREHLRECGGLDLWLIAGTTSLERARIFWNSAKLNAWRTWTKGVVKPGVSAW